MAYALIDDADIKAPLAANSAAWTSIIDNDVELWNGYEPAFEANPLIVSSTAAREFRFRVRGGDSVVGDSTNGVTMLVAVRAVSSGAAVPVTVTFGSTVDTSISVVALDWYETPAIGLPYSAEPREVVISSAATGGPNMVYHAIRCVYDAGSSGNRYYASGWVKTPSFWYTADRPVPSEVVARLRNNPIAIAQSRPICVAFHCCDTVRAVSTKSTELWGIENETAYHVVGRLQVPYCDREERTYLVDCYTTESSPGTGEFTVKIGGVAETWTGPGWHSWTVRLGGGTPHAVIAAVKAGSSNKAAIRTFQVWRMDALRDGRASASEGATTTRGRSEA